MPSRRFIATAALITVIGAAAFTVRMNHLDRESAATSTGSPFVASRPQRDRIAAEKPRPDTGAFVPSPDRCPHFAPRTIAANGRDWRVYADRAHCLTVEYPKNWEVTTVDDRISIDEPTEHGKGEYFETTYIGEMTGVIHLAFSTANNWANEQPGYARRNTVIYSEDVGKYYSAVASFRMLLPDRTIIDIDGYAPPKDGARIDTVKSILRSIEAHDRPVTTSLKPYVN